MKNFIYTIVLVLVTVFSVTLMSSKNYQSDESSVPAGTVISSLLPPDLMNKKYPGQWVLLDGKPLSQSTELFQLLQQESRTDILGRKDDQVNLLPDARGVFIRGMNIGRDKAAGDQEGDRNVGAAQADAFQGHRHFDAAELPLLQGVQAPNNPRQRNTVNGTSKNTAGTVDAGYGTPRVAQETRPRNISLYTYIKTGN